MTRWSVLRKRALAICITSTLCVLVASSPTRGDEYSRLPGEPPPPPASDMHYMGPEEAAAAAKKFIDTGMNPSSDVWVDTVVNAISVAYPPAGTLLGLARGLVGGTAADPTGQAINRLNAQLADVNKRLDDLNQRVDLLTQRVGENSNNDNVRELSTRRALLKNLLDELALHESDPNARQKLANEALNLADRFLEKTSSEEALWMWADRAHVYTDRSSSAQTKPLKADLLPPRFKPSPTLEYYLATLATAAAAIENRGLDAAQVKKQYGARLIAHAKFLSVRPYWLEGTEPADPGRLPERVMAQVDCVQQPTSNYADRGGMCNWSASCTDRLAVRSNIPAGDGAYFMGKGTALMCTLPVREAKLDGDPSEPLYGTAALNTVLARHDINVETTLEEQWGVAAMAVMADQLARLAQTGSTREPVATPLPITTAGFSILYAVDPSGKLQWYRHQATEDRSQALPSKVQAQETSGIAGAVSDDERAPSALGGVKETGLVAAPKASSPSRWSHEWSGPREVGNGWTQFVDVYPAALRTNNGRQDGFALLAQKPDGVLAWYRHDGYLDGTVNWTRAVDVGNGWSQFKTVFSGGDGVMYAIAPDGQLRWYRFYDAQTAAAPTNWSPPITVGNGWGNFLQVFSAGEGIIYAVQPDGTLLWYRHIDYQTGIEPVNKSAGAHALGKRTARWTGPKTVGSGWQNFKAVFSSGNGHIYAIDGAGDLYWYYHRGYQDGSVDWTKPHKLASGWNQYKETFAVIWGAPPPSSVK